MTVRGPIERLLVSSAGHTLASRSAGFEVRPRIEAIVGRGARPQAHAATGPKLPFGVEELDRMLRGAD